MKLKILRPLRMVFSLAVLFLTIFIFINFTGIFSKEIIRSILFFQFIPSFLLFIRAASLAAAGFIAVLAFTFFFGRVYCSFLCPLGVILDIISGLNLRFGERRAYKYQKPVDWLKYSILSLVILIFMTGNIFFLNLLDPFSISGRIFSNLVRPCMGLVPTGFISRPAMLFSFGIFILLTLLAMYRDRWYCNAICPVGTLLGLVSKVSILGLKIDKATCTQCGDCEKVCKAGCIQFPENRIDIDRCVSCYNCIGKCQSNSIRFKFRLPAMINGISSLF